jgi:hypothetical protein
VMEKTRDKVYIWLTIATAVFICIGAYFGIWNANTYMLETENWKVQGIAQDMVDLFIIVPILIVSGYFSYRKNKISLFVFGGTTLFLIYTYAIYTFAVHFNFLFLVYCFTFGLSIYSFIYFISTQSSTEVKNWFADKVPFKLTGCILIFFAVLFYFLWLSEIIPAVIQNKIPQSLIETGLLTNPVHVIDISILLPGMFLLSIFLFKRMRVAFLLTPVVLVFCVLMDISIGGLVIVMKQKGIAQNLTVAYIMGFFALVSFLLLLNFLKHLNEFPHEK